MKRTFEQVEKEFIEAQKAYDKKWNEDKTETWDDFLVYAKNEIDAMTTLGREKRMMMPYELTNIPDFADVMSLKDFIACCKDGSFIDYDGSGNYCIDNKETNITVYPSDIINGAIRWEFDAVAWYNR